MSWRFKVCREITEGHPARITLTNPIVIERDQRLGEHYAAGYRPIAYERYVNASGSTRHAIVWRQNT